MLQKPIYSGVKEVKTGKKLTVLQVVEATEGGVRRHLRDLLQTLDPGVVSCYLALSAQRNPGFQRDLDMYRRQGFSTTIIPMYRNVSLFSDLTALFKLVALIRRLKPDLIHAHSSKAGALARIAGALGKVPVVYTPHGIATLMQVSRCKARFYKWVECWLRRYTTAMVVLSSEEHGAVQQLGYQLAQLYHIPNGVEEIDPLPLNIRDEFPLTIGFFGRLAPQKGADLFIKASVRVLEKLPQTKFVLYGGGPLLKSLQHLTVELGVSDQVEFAGEYQLEEVLALMRKVDIIALPSRWEGCPYVVLEAFQAGVPLIASQIGGINDLVVHNQSGLLVPTEDDQALAAGIVQLGHNPALRHTLAEGGREVLLSHTLAKMGASLQSLYLALAPKVVFLSFITVVVSLFCRT